MNWDLRRINVLCVIFFIILGSNITAQIAPDKYWIQFTDKNNSPFSIDSPNVFLSQRAIDRRAAQNISITVQDLPVNPVYVTGVKISGNIQVLTSSKWMNGLLIETTDTAGLDQIMKLPFVDSVNSRSVERSNKRTHSNKMDVLVERTEKYQATSFPERGLDYGLSELQNKMLKINYLHDLGYTGSGMVIAVLDAGFIGADTTTIIQPLFNNNQILGTWDFVTGQPVDYNQHSNHGTYVLNCMGANVAGLYIGTAPDANYWLIRTEDAPTEYVIEEYNWVVGAEFADSVGADIINSSLGYTTFDDSTQNHTYSDMDGNTTVITKGADIAASKGILVVNSAGNSGNDDWYYIGAPADGDSVLAIGAVWGDSTVTSFSSRGPSSDGRVKPNVMAMGGWVPMAIGTDSVRYINGTSFSGPILAGAAACLWQSRSGFSNMEISEKIEQSCHLYVAPNDDYGHGIPDFELAYNLINGMTTLNNNSNELHVYPNPANDWIEFQLDKKAVKLVSLTDLSGKLVMQMDLESMNSEVARIDLSHLNPGIYFLNQISLEGVLTYRIIKQ